MVVQRKRDGYAWYPWLEGIWAVLVVIAAALGVLAVLPTVLLALVVGLGLFFALVRIVAAVAELRGRAV